MNRSMTFMATLGLFVLHGCIGSFPEALPLATDAEPPPPMQDMTPPSPPPPSDPDSGPPAPDASPSTTDEACNDSDDDQDGRIDEGLSRPHSNQEGLCAGATESCQAGEWVLDPIQGFDPADPCDGIDNDCDGTPDEAWNVGEDCTRGVGACAANGKFECTPEGTARCTATPGSPSDETCNGIDDDCDGEPDNGVPAEPCRVQGQAGVCAESTSSCVNGVSECPQTIFAQDEICDGTDTDCDGEVDNVEGLGDRCIVGFGRCETDGNRACPAGAPPAGANVDATDGTYCATPAPPPAPLERDLCNDIDDDCDDQIDEGDACSAAIARHCSVRFAWASADNPREVSPAWPGCARAPGGEQEDDFACATTAGDQTFSVTALRWTDGLQGSQIGLAFHCEADEPAGFPAHKARAIQANCNAVFGRTSIERNGPGADDAWGGLCRSDRTSPFANAANLDPGAVECTSSEEAGEGAVVPRPLTIHNPIVSGATESWAIAFRCEGPFNPTADEIQAVLAIGGPDGPALDGAESWGDGGMSCPELSFAAGDDFACAGSGLDGQFGAFSFPAAVIPDEDEEDATLRVGVMLRLRDDAP